MGSGLYDSPPKSGVIRPGSRTELPLTEDAPNSQQHLKGQGRHADGLSYIVRTELSLQRAEAIARLLRLFCPRRLLQLTISPCGCWKVHVTPVTSKTFDSMTLRPLRKPMEVFGERPSSYSSSCCTCILVSVNVTVHVAHVCDEFTALVFYP